MLAAAIMSRNPVTVDGDHTVLHVARLMRDRDVGSVVVVDSRGRPRGIVTDRDLAVRVLPSEGVDLRTPVDRVMSHPVFSCGEDELLFDLLRSMAERRIRRCPVVDAQGAAVGMVSMDDVMLLLTTELSNVAEVLGSASRGLKDDSEE